jgi:hypothetical protein
MEYDAMNLNGLSFQVSATAAAGVVSSGTRLDLAQRGNRIVGRYRGGSIERGYLVGSLAGRTLQFRYSQLEKGEGIHGGRSICALHFLSDGRLRIRENFVWGTREGTGVNIFDQIDTGHQPRAS